MMIAFIRMSIVLQSDFVFDKACADDIEKDASQNEDNLFNDRNEDKIDDEDVHDGNGDD